MAITRVGAAEIERRLIEIIDRAEYAGHLDGFASVSRHKKKVESAREGAVISRRLAEKMARELVADLTA